MLFVIAGVLLVALKLLEFGSVAAWPWWMVLLPFGFAVLWWTWADMSGFTKRRAMGKMDDKKTARRRKALAALGLDHRAFDKEQKRAAAFKASRQRQINSVEGKRDAERKKQRDSILQSRFQSSHLVSEQDGAPARTDSKP